MRTLLWYNPACVVLTLFRVREFVCVTSRTRACAHSIPKGTRGNTHTHTSPNAGPLSRGKNRTDPSTVCSLRRIPEIMLTNGDAAANA